MLCRSKDEVYGVVYNMVYQELLLCTSHKRNIDSHIKVQVLCMCVCVYIYMFYQIKKCNINHPNLIWDTIECQ